MNSGNPPANAQATPASDSALPLYHQVYLMLRAQILEGSFATDSKLPGEQKLASQLDVSRVTVRRALRLLETDLLIERRQGVGTRVTPHRHKAAKPNDLGGITANKENLDGIGDYPTEAIERVKPPKGLRKLFTPHEEIARVIRIRKSGEVPYSITTFYVPLPIMADIDGNEFDSRPVLKSITDTGITLHKAEQTINATAATDTQANILNIPVGSPLIVMTGTFFDTDGNTVIFNEGFFRPEYYEYRNTLFRKDTDKGVRWLPEP